MPNNWKSCLPTTKLAFFLIATIFIAACSTTKPTKPNEYYNNLNLEPEPSVINIPLKFYKSELLKAMNDQIGDMLYEDNNLKDDGLAIRAKKRENITIDINEQEIKYRIPVDLWIKKDLMFSAVEGEGSLALEFSTRYNIKPDWSLETTTTLTTYKWLREPVIKLGFADLPITPIANLVINQTRNTFAKSIDDEVKNLFDLKKEMERTWKEMHDPFQLSEEYATWLLLNPQSVSMTPFKSNGYTVESTVVVVTKPQISLGDKPSARNVGKLPDFGYAAEGADNFSLFLDTEVPFKEAERLSKQNMVGEVFSYKNKQVRVEDMGLYGQGNKLVVRTNLKGSYNGDVFLIAEPVYDAEANQVKLKDVDFDFSSQKALMKSASWLFKGPMKKQVQESLDFYLKYNLEDSKKSIQEALRDYELAPGIHLNGLLDDLSISNVYVATNAIRVRIGLKGKLNLDVRGF
ncbi:MAG: DUF4403 family protein [Saprospiraceae bacterium]|nr:DUF4403 family protein [Saprospiraceae bacterium]MCF8249918.1 DUF4403 family protein [Saprospiraceae bacterium]MCF8279331.1 DUF4403 family protein [Bacteroidales bacterium]MCF8310022.1 DUF4403 family protein [Saprospiraceae bacterium]MCF8438922.1 DUF4403 family protein [Saprospiraceae bacterium]